MVSTRQDTVILIEFGLGGHSETHAPKGNATSHLSGYAQPGNWEARGKGDYIYPDGTPVLNKRHIFEERPSLGLTSPLLGVRLKPGEIDSLDAGTIQDSIVGQALMGETGNQFGSLLKLQAIQKTSKPKEYGSLDKIAMDLYLEYWLSHGAIYGEIKDNVIVWGD